MTACHGALVVEAICDPTKPISSSERNNFQSGDELRGFLMKRKQALSVLLSSQL